MILLSSCNPVAQTTIQDLFNPGIYASLDHSTLSTSSSTVKSGESITVTLSLRDNNNNTYLSINEIIEFSISGGTSTGSLSGIKNLGDGRYTASFMGISAGTPISIFATINGKKITTSLPAVQVLPGDYSLAYSSLTLSSNSVNSASTVTATLTVKDVDNNALTNGGLAVTFHAASGTSTVSIGSTVDNQNGTYTATITGIVSGTATTISAKIAGSSITSSLPQLTVSYGAISQLAFSTQPSPSGSTDNALATQPVISARDVNGNTVLNYSGSIILTAYSDTSCSTLVSSALVAASNPVTATSGLATFSLLKVLKTSVRSIKASNGTLSVCSNTLSITPGAIQSLSFTTQPAPLSTNADSVFSTQPVITAYDSESNIVTNDSSSTITLSAYDATSCAGSVVASGLSGTSSLTLANGVATFTNIKAVKGAVKSIKATVGGVSVCSSTLTVSPGAIQSLSFTTSPAPLSPNTDTALTTQPVITAYDANSNILTNDSASTLSLAAYDGTSCSGSVVAGGLSGTSSLTVNQGVATFTNIKIVKTNVQSIKGTLGVKTVCFGNFTVAAGSPTQIAIVSGNSQSAYLGAALSLPLSVNVKDANNNVTSSATINWSASSGALGSGSSTTTDASGNTSNTLTLATNATAAGGKTVTATINGTATSVSFTITANVATPTGLAGTNGAGASALSWTATTGATSYKIYRSTTSGSGYTLVNSSATNSYSDSGLSNGTTYYYVVSAVNNSVEGSQSSETSVTPVVAPGAPTNFTGTLASQQTVLTWGAPSTGTAPFTYKVYRSTTMGSGYSNIATTGAGILTYTDTGLTNGTTYYYVVTALNGSASGESSYSGEIAVTPDYSPTLSYDFTSGSSFQPHNLLTYSSTFTDVIWQKNSNSVQANVAVAPDGTFTASKLIDNTTPAEHILIQTRTATNETGTFSVYLKAGEYTKAQIQISNTVNEAVYFKFNLTNCTSISAPTTGTDYTNIRTSVWKVGGGWCRAVLTATKGSVNSTNAVTIAPLNSSNASSFSGTGNSGIYIWGAQYELNPGVSRYVATTSSIATNFITPLSATTGGTNLTFSRADTAAAATVYGSDGKLRRAPHNIARYSEQFDNAIWQKASTSINPDQTIAPNGTNTADKMTETTSTATRYALLTITKPATALTYTLSVYVKSTGDDRSVKLQMDDAVTGGVTSGAFKLSTGAFLSSVGAPGASFTNASQSFQNVGNGWYRLSLTTTTNTATAVRPVIFMADASGSHVNYLGNGVSSIYVWGAQLEENTSPSFYIETTSATRFDGPRFDYDPVTLAPRGLLIEETRSNYFSKSADYSSGWSFNAVSATPTAATSPTNETNAFKLVENTANTFHFSSQSITSTPGTYTLSIFAKAAERSWIYLNIYDATTDHGGYFNLSTGAVGSTTGNTSRSAITPLGNSWYRVEISVPTTATTLYPSINLASGNNGRSYLGDGSSGLYVWGAQVERGEYASYYIPTIGSYVTRIKEVATGTTSGWYSPTAGTILSQAQSYSPITSGTDAIAAVCALNDGGGASRIDLRYNQEGFNRGFLNSLLITYPAVTAQTLYNLGLSYDSSTVSWSRNGSTTQDTPTANSLPGTSVTQLQIGSFDTQSYQINGWIKNFKYHNTKLPDGDLSRLSQ